MSVSRKNYGEAGPLSLLENVRLSHPSRPILRLTCFVVLIVVGLCAGDGWATATQIGEATEAGARQVGNGTLNNTLNVAQFVVALVAAGLLFAAVRWRWYRLSDRTEHRWLAHEPGLGLILAASLFLIPAILPQFWINVPEVAPDDPNEQIRLVVTLRLWMAVVFAVLAAAALSAWLSWRRRIGGRVGMQAGGMRSGGIASAKPMSWSMTVIAPVLMLLFIAPVLITVSWIGALLVTALTGQEPDVLAHEALVMMTEADRGRLWITMIVLIVVAAPLTEEIVFRGCLQPALIGAGMGRWTAIAVTSVTFVVLHVTAADVHVLPTLFVLSVAMGWLYEKTGRLTAPVLLHMLFNGANSLLALTAV